MTTLARPLPGYFVSGTISSDAFTRSLLRFGEGEQSVEIETCAPAVDSVVRLVDELRLTRRRVLADRPIAEIVEVIGEVARRWLRPDDPYRSLAEQVLPVVTGFSPPMISALLTRMFRRYTTDNLWALLREELHDPLVLDTYRPRREFDGWSRAYGPTVVTHVLGGNNPALAAVSLIFALLCKAASLTKVSTHEPVFAPLFARSLAAVDEELASTIAVVGWLGGNTPLESTAFAACDTVVVFGGDRSIEAIRRLVPTGKQFVAYGHRAAVAAIGREVMTTGEMARAAEHAAVDVSMADQLSCLSPQVIYVEAGGERSPRQFATALADALAATARLLPRGAVPASSGVALNEFRYTYQFRGYAAPEATGPELLSPADGGSEWLVVYDPEPQLLPSPGYRSIRVCPLPQLEALVPLVEAVRPLVSSIGVRTAPDRVLALAERLGEVGVSRICPLGSMVDPGLGWHHDGWWNLSTLLRWTDVEAWPASTGVALS